MEAYENMEELMNDTEEIEEIEEYSDSDTGIDAGKQEKFFTESKERMNKICTQIAYLEKIAGKRSVDYTLENVEKMFSYLENELASCKKTFMARFEKEEKSRSFDFDF